MAVPFPVLLLVQCALLPNVFGVTLSPCGSDNTAEVIEGKTDNTFTCTGLGSGQQVDWSVEYKSTVYSAGNCPSVSSGKPCNQGQFGEAFTASRVSNTESRMVVNPTELNVKEFIEEGILKCKDSSNNEDSCQMDYIVPAQGTCSVQTGTGAAQFELSGTCNLQSGAKSSRDRFKCHWYRDGQSVTTVSLSESTYQTGCVMTNQPLPISAGQYTYTVTLLPGREEVTAGTVSITKPQVPTVSGCGGDDYIPENTTVRCTCTTTNIGQPPGRLQWVKVGDGSDIPSGNYGNKSFTASQTLQRNDDQSTKFRCAVDWVTGILGNDIKFNVGYPPTQVFLGLNSVQDNLSVNEHQSVKFSCQTTDGRPSESLLSLVSKDNTTTLSSRKKPNFDHQVVARCEDSGQYVCTADNGMGPKATSPTRSLSVKCSPRGNYDVGEVNFLNDPVSVSFDVTAYPVPDQVTFQYLGPTINDTDPRDTDDTKIQLTGKCLPKSGVIYMSTCTVTVSKVTSHAVQGFYQVTVSNERGTEHFRLKVLYKAPVPEPPSSKTSESETDSSFPLGVAVGACVVLVLDLIIVVVIVIWLWRRQWKLPCAKTADLPSPNTEPVSPSDDYLEPTPRLHQHEGPYDSLRMDEVGQKSVYSEIDLP